ncbi:MAG: PAS domain S-box protein [Coriobacteriia bacterium]|nr:PAS domain S-box protein [Coriobacteriia bacterium]
MPSKATKVGEELVEASITASARLQEALGRQRATGGKEDLFITVALQNAIFNSANFSSIATDAKGVIQIFNVGAERMLGYTADDVLNKVTPAAISDPQEIVARAEALSLEFETPIAPGFEALVFKAARGIEDIYELTYIRKDGSRFPAVVSVTALRDDDEVIIGYLLIGTDNTARKQVEEERTKLDQSLRDQQFYTRSLIESGIDPIVTTDPQGIITDVNKQMEQLTGCTRDELIGAPVKKFFTDPVRAEDSIRRTLAEGRITDYELTAHSRDGTETVVSYNATTFYDRDRRLQGVFASARDVTERKRLDDALRDKNAELESARVLAEEANRSKSDFLSSMSHELRSPLNAILGFAQLMESESPAPSPRQQESIEQILQAGWHLLALINEVLDLTKVESGALSLSIESVPVADVMGDCQSMVGGQARDRGIRMTYPPFDVPVYVRADRTRLKQVIVNLLSNAIKYNYEGGAVDVTCGSGSPGHVRFAIKDTGSGLTPDQIAQLFQPFNRLGQEAGGPEGTGIGLVVAKQLVELMGGVIGVESIPGTGSEFWFEMLVGAEPQTLAEISGAEAVRAPVRRGAKTRVVLYVEDNPANLRLVEQLIARRPDLELLSAATGYLGLELARANTPDLILMDINLPDISGIEVLRHLREDPTTSGIPIVAVSANAMPHDVQRGLEAGFLRYLAKPIIVAQFMEMLDAVLASSDDAGDEDRGAEATL